jgi:hypothetical protein
LYADPNINPKPFGTETISCQNVSCANPIDSADPADPADKQAPPLIHLTCTWFLTQTGLVGVIPPSYPACSSYNNRCMFLWFGLSVRFVYLSRYRNLLIVSV